MGCGMDQEAEAPLDDLESVQDDDPDDEYLGRSSSSGSRVGSVAGSIAT